MPEADEEGICKLFVNISNKVAKPTRKQFLRSIRMLQSSYEAMMGIFGYLSTRDLLRLRRVCRSWNRLAVQPCLWRRVYLKGVHVMDWEKAFSFFKTFDVLKINFEGYLEKP